MHPVEEYQDITLTVNGLNECETVTLAGRRVDVKIFYNSVHRKFNELGIRRVGDKMLEWGTCPREAGPPGPRLSSPGERERNAVMAIRVGVNMSQFCSVSISLSHTTLSIKWEVYFSKELCRSSLLCRCYYSACICICACIVVHGYTTPSVRVLSSVLNRMVGWLFGFYGISTFVGYLMPNPVLFQTI